MVRCVVVVCFGLMVSVNVAAAQPPPPPPPMPGTSMTMAEATAPEVGTAALSGVVVDGVTGSPVAGALVAISGATPGGQARPRQMTDSRGRYIFTHLPASGYFLSVSRPGYLDGGYRRTPGVTGGVRINLADGQWFTEGDVQIWRPASIGGTIRDERGEPLVGIPVRIVTRLRVGGANRWVSGPSTTTDDRGVYRIPGLLAGGYIVHVPSVQVTMPSGAISLYQPPQRPVSTGAASPTAARVLPDILRGTNGVGVVVGHYATPGSAEKGSAYPMMFHPAARTLDLAEVVDVGFGDERTDVDVAVAPVPTVSVSGQVVGPVEAITGMPVRLVPRGSEAMGAGAEAGLTRADAQGTFTFQLVPPGEYTVLASRTYSEYAASGATQQAPVMPAAANLFVNRSSSSQVAGTNGVMLKSQSAAGFEATGRVSITVGAQSVAGITIPLTPSVRVSGHFEWEGSVTPPEGLFPPSVRLEPADGDAALGLPFGAGPRPAPGQPPLTRVDFTIDNVVPGHYVLGRILAGAGWTIAGAEWKGRDVLAAPLVVDGDAPVEGLVIRMTLQRNRLTGAVRTQSGAAATEGAVLAFPATPAAWRQSGISAIRFGNVAVQSNGTYTLPLLPPGEYYLAAVPPEDRHRWSDADFLAAIAPQASRITVTSNSALTQDLRLIGGGR